MDLGVGVPMIFLREPRLLIVALLSRCPARVFTASVVYTDLLFAYRKLVFEELIFSAFLTFVSCVSLSSRGEV